MNLNIRSLIFILILSILILFPTFTINISSDRPNSRFLAGPNFSEKQVPRVWYDIHNWLVAHGVLDQNFRTFVLPLAPWAPYSTLNLLPTYVPNYFQIVGNFTDFINYLIEGRGTNFGKVLAPAGVKYVVVPYAAVLPSCYGGSDYATGNPRLWAGYADIWWPIGNPDDYVKLLNNQRDLKLVYNGTDFLVYENLDFIENIALYKGMYLVYENPLQLPKFLGNEYIEVPSSSSFNITDAITIEVWFKPLGAHHDSVVTKGWPYLIFGGTNEQNPKVQFGLAFTDGTNSWNNTLIGNTNMNGRDPYTWNHIVGTYNGHDMKVYVNGKLDGSLHREGKKIQTTQIPIWIGQSDWGGHSTIIPANIMIYNVALTPSQIQKQFVQGIFSVPTETKGLIAWWPIWRTANNQIVDFSGHRNTGILKSIGSKLVSNINYMFDSNIPKILDDTFNANMTRELLLVQAGMTGEQADKFAKLADGYIVYGGAEFNSSRNIPEKPTLYIDEITPSKGKFNLSFNVSSDLYIAAGIHLANASQFNVEIDGFTLLSLNNNLTTLNSFQPIFVSSGSHSLSIIPMNDRLIGNDSINKFGFVLSYPFNEGMGSIVYDATNNENDETIYGASWTSDKFGKALSFDGVDDYVAVKSLGSLNLTTQITLSAWIKPNDITTNQYYEIMRQENGDNRKLLSFQEWGRQLTLGLNTGGEYWETDFNVDPNYFTDGNWHFVVYTYDGSYARLYIDGNLNNLQAHTGKIGVSTSPLIIGSSEGYSDFFNGMIGELCISYRSLSSDEVSSMYELTVPQGHVFLLQSKFYNLTLNHFFSKNTLSSYEVEQDGPTSYQISVTEKSFIVLSESYQENWQATVSQALLEHLRLPPYNINLFYKPLSEDGFVTIYYGPQKTWDILNSLRLISWVFILLLFIIDSLFRGKYANQDKEKHYK